MTRFNTISIKNGTAMREFGAKIARETQKAAPGRHARVIALVGNLGAGKTTFTQGFLKKLGVKRRVISPTFLIVRPYKLPATSYKLAFHIDCYRLHKPEELLTLGLRDIIKEPGHILLIEWPELVKKYLPKDTQWIYIEHPEKGTHRNVKVS